MTGKIDISVEQSRKIANLSFLCALLVVVIHVRWPWMDGWRSFAVLMIRETLARAAVPIFFVISGYFLSCHFDESNWWPQQIRKRIYSLIIPYVFWTLFHALVIGSLVHSRVIGPMNFGFDLTRWPLVGPLWFVRGLFLLVLISPMVNKLTKISPRTYLGCLIVSNVFYAWLIGSGIVRWDSGIGGSLRWGVPLEGLLYFSIGCILCRQRELVLKRNVLIMAFWLGICALLGKMVTALVGGHLAFDDNVLIIPALIIWLWRLIPSRAFPKCIIGSAFSIYLMHWTVIVTMRTLDCANCWLEFALGVLIPILIYNSLRKIPRVGLILLGGRI